MLVYQYNAQRDRFEAKPAAEGSESGGAPVGPLELVEETSFGQSPNGGISTNAAAADHTHGTPEDPVPAHEAAADPHTGYAKLAGRSSGQTLQGGTAASEDLTLESTAHATKGLVRVRGGAAGTSPTWDPVDVMIVEQDSARNGAVQLFTAANRIGGWMFANPTNGRNEGGMTYVHSQRTLYLAAAANERLKLSSSGAELLTGDLRLNGATSGYVGLAPAAAAGSTVFTLPSADGSGGQLLGTNGAAQLGFYSAPSASAPPSASDYVGGNMVCNWTTAGPITGQTGLPEWWERSSADITVTVVDCATEGLPTDKSAKAFKIVTSGSGSGVRLYQRMAYGVHDLLVAGVAASCGWWVYQASGGSTITGRIRDSAGSTTASDTSTVNAAWDLVSCENTTMPSGGVTYVDYSIEVAANSKTFYVIPAGFNRGPKLRPWENNPLVYVYGAYQTLFAVDPADTSWHTVSGASIASPRTVAFVVQTDVQGTAANQTAHLRPSYSSDAQGIPNRITVTQGGSVIMGEAIIGCNAAQQIDWSANSANISVFNAYLKGDLRFAY